MVLQLTFAVVIVDGEGQVVHEKAAVSRRIQQRVLAVARSALPSQHLLLPRLRKQSAEWFWSHRPSSKASTLYIAQQHNEQPSTATLIRKGIPLVELEPGKEVCTKE